MTKTDLAAYLGVIVPAYVSLSAEQKEMIDDYQRGGGKISVLAETASASGLNAEILAPSQINSSNAKSAEAQVLAEINFSLRWMQRVLMLGIRRIMCLPTSHPRTVVERLSSTYSIMDRLQSAI